MCADTLRRARMCESEAAPPETVTATRTFATRMQRLRQRFDAWRRNKPRTYEEVRGFLAEIYPPSEPEAQRWRVPSAMGVWAKASLCPGAGYHEGDAIVLPPPPPPPPPSTPQGIPERASGILYSSEGISVVSKAKQWCAARDRTLKWWVHQEKEPRRGTDAKDTPGATTLEDMAIRENSVVSIIFKSQPKKQIPRPGWTSTNMACSTAVATTTTAAAIHTSPTSSVATVNIEIFVSRKDAEKLEFSSTSIRLQVALAWSYDYLRTCLAERIGGGCKAESIYLIVDRQLPPRPQNSDRRKRREAAMELKPEERTRLKKLLDSKPALLKQAAVYLMGTYNEKPRQVQSEPTAPDRDRASTTTAATATASVTSTPSATAGAMPTSNLDLIALIGDRNLVDLELAKVGPKSPIYIGFAKKTEKQWVPGRTALDRSELHWVIDFPVLKKQWDDSSSATPYRNILTATVTHVLADLIQWREVVDQKHELFSDPEALRMHLQVNRKKAQAGLLPQTIDELMALLNYKGRKRKLKRKLAEKIKQANQLSEALYSLEELTEEERDAAVAQLAKLANYVFQRSRFQNHLIEAFLWAEDYVRCVRNHSTCFYTCSRLPCQFSLHAHQPSSSSTRLIAKERKRDRAF